MEGRLFLGKENDGVATWLGGPGFYNKPRRFRLRRMRVIHKGARAMSFTPLHCWSVGGLSCLWSRKPFLVLCLLPSRTVLPSARGPVVQRWHRAALFHKLDAAARALSKAGMRTVQPYRNQTYRPAARPTMSPSGARLPQRASASVRRGSRFPIAMSSSTAPACHGRKAD